MQHYFHLKNKRIVNVNVNVLWIWIYAKVGYAHTVLLCVYICYNNVLYKPIFEVLMLSSETMHIEKWKQCNCILKHHWLLSFHFKTL